MCRSWASGSRAAKPCSDLRCQYALSPSLGCATDGSTSDLAKVSASLWSAGQRYTLEHLCELAAEKDPGFDCSVRRCVGCRRGSLDTAFRLEPKAVAALRV